VRHHLRLHFFEEFVLPLPLCSPLDAADHPLQQGMARDRAEFQAGASNFAVRSRLGSGDTVVEVHSDSAFPPAFDLQLQEALQYITGKTAIWRARLESDRGMFTLELASPTRRAAHTQFNPPISPGATDFSQHTWRLFERFLTFVIENTPVTTDERHWNPVAYHLYMARESTSASIDAWAAGASIAVEALTSLVESASNQEADARWAEFRTRALRWLEEQPDFLEDVKKRAQGLIGGSAAKSTKQRLRELAERGHIDLDCVKAWAELRSRHIHPNLLDLLVPGETQYKKLFIQLWQVGTLLHQLTFRLIGYEGPFTDYGHAGLVSRQYPLPKLAAAAESLSARLSAT